MKRLGLGLLAIAVLLISVSCTSQLVKKEEFKPIKSIAVVSFFSNKKLYKKELIGDC